MKMESQGVTISEAFDNLELDSQGKITIAGFSRFIRKWFPHLEKDEILKLLTSIDIDGDSMYDLDELQ